MSAHIVVDLQVFGHLEKQLPSWQEKCALVGITVHALRWPMRSASGDKAEHLLQCTETVEELCDNSFDLSVYDEVDQLLAEPAVGHVLLVTSLRFARLLTKHAKLTLCCDDEQSLLSLSWAVRLKVHTLTELGWRSSVDATMPVGIWIEDEPVGAASWLWGERDQELKGLRPGGSTASSLPLSSSETSSDASEADDDDDELTRSLLNPSCRAGCLEFRRCSPEDGRFVLPH